MDAVLDAALLVFRERGFHTASLSDLSLATGLTVGSIYKAFGDKRTMFLAAFDRFTEVRGLELDRRIKREKSGLGKLRAMLRFYADSSYGSEGRLGCLVVNSATELTLFDAEMAARVTNSLKRTTTRFRELIGLGQLDGSVSANIDLEASASLLLYLVQGFRVMGKTGKTRAELMDAVDGAMKLFS